MFIIVGVLVLVVTAGLLFLAETMTTQTIEAGQEIIAEGYEFEHVRSFVEQCLKKTSEEGLGFVSLQGGYYHVPEPAEDYVFVQIPYYFDVGQKHFPTKEIIAQQIELYVEDKMETCLNDFVAFKNQGYTFREEEMKADVRLEKNINFELEYPLQIQKGESIKEFNHFSHTLPVDFEDVYSTIEQAVSEQEKNANFVPLGYLSVASQEANFTFEAGYRDNDVVVYSFIFNRYQIDERKFAFAFASRYDWAELAAKRELDYVQEIEDQRCYAGDICSYNLNIYNDAFLFEDYTALFDISREGKIQFIPQEKDTGTHTILVRIYDDAGNEKFITFSLVVESLAERLVMKSMGSQRAVVGQEFTYQIELEESVEGVIFSDDTELFEIDETGIITFIPTAEHVGFHSITITAQKGERTDTEWMYLRVHNEE